MMWGPSNTAGRIDSAFLVIVAACVVLLAVVTVCMVLFLVRYNRGRHPRPEKVGESLLLEITWTVVPTILVILMFYFGWVDFDYIRNPPKEAATIHVTARQWSWLFTYDNGKQSDMLRVPLGKPVQLVMTSLDVIHSLYIPAFRIKEDCVPGMKTHLWFTATKAGSYDLFCTEYCGTGHSHMRAKVIALTPDDFETWLATPESTALADAGPKLLLNKGCIGCHTLDGSAKIGPSFKGLLGRREIVIIGGREREITVDETFVRAHILDPRASPVKGYPPVMPQVPVTKDELKTIIAYLETLR